MSKDFNKILNEKCEKIKAEYGSIPYIILNDNFIDNIKFDLFNMNYSVLNKNKTISIDKIKTIIITYKSCGSSGMPNIEIKLK